MLKTVASTALHFGTLNGDSEETAPKMNKNLKDAVQSGCRTGQIKDGCRRERMQDRSDAVQDGCRKGRLLDRSEAG